MNHTAALHGDALYALLDQVHTLLNDYHHSGPTAISRAERIAATIELLEQHSFAPADLDELERVHDLWLYLDRPEAASALLQAHRERVLAAVVPHERAHAQVRLDLSDIQSRTRFEPLTAAAALLPTAQSIAALPAEVDASDYWLGWQHLAQKLQAWDIAATGIDLQRAHARQQQEAPEDTAYLDALACVRKAEMTTHSGRQAEAVQQVQAAIDSLRDAGADQAVDFDRWMELAALALPLAPHSLPALLMACTQQLARTEQPPPSQAVQAHRQVRTVRLQAQACALAGQIDAALQLAPLGHFGLTDDEGDPFSALQLKWLVQAGRLDEAAALALESALHTRPVSAVHAVRLALERLDTDPARATTWALILACARMDEDLHRLLARETMPPHPAEVYLERVRAAQPQHPVLALLEGMQLASKRQMAQALPLLEQSVGQHPEMADSNKLPALWAARFAALPLEEALGRLFPQAHGGHWCYAAGVVLDDAGDLAPLMGGKKHVPAQEVREPLVLRYYEEGLARFEQFWATGQGAYKDADLHVYSMLCNNLGIKYRFQNRFEEAAALHHKGLESSPFAEHHNSLVWCAIGLEDYEQTVIAAERLWHFAQEHGYSRHDAPRYLPSVTYALYRLDRDDEITIWMERLEQWFDSLDEDDQARRRRDYLAALMAMLDFFSATRPEQVLPRLRSHQAEVEALGECYTLRRLACALQAYPELLEESLALHRQAHANLGPRDDESEHRVAREGIAQAERKLAERDAQAAAATRKPWWKLW